ncbi:MAG: hypothetical protein K9M99_05800 [Candidatus Cloacimonetes bacterium]|nr:hypothetical protein [Candidatus Cloacimonadota bacterium]
MFDLQKLHDQVGKGLKISMVFGDPIEAQGKTIIPVSKVAGGFGGGEGSAPVSCCGNDTDGDKALPDEGPHGTGGGGGLHNEAIGVFEITPDNTRFIPVVQFKHVIVVLGMIMGFIWKLSRKRRRK